VGDRWTGAGAAKGFAVPLAAGLALWVVSVYGPQLVLFLSYSSAVELPYVGELAGLLVPLLGAVGLALVVLGVFRLLRALEVHLSAGRPETSRPDAGRAADR